MEKPSESTDQQLIDRVKIYEIDHDPEGWPAVKMEFISELANRLRLALNFSGALALILWREYYKNDSPNFELCDTAAGIVTQIDNMVTGLTRIPEDAKG